MQVSARNQIVGTVKEIKHDDIMAEVVVTLDGGSELVSVITASSVKNLGIEVGKKVNIVIKSTDVLLATEH